MSNQKLEVKLKIEGKMKLWGKLTITIKCLSVELYRWCCITTFWAFKSLVGGKGVNQTCTYK